MFDSFQELKEQLFQPRSSASHPSTPLVRLRAALAELFLATGAGATLEHMGDDDGRLSSLAIAPALIGPVAALAHLEHSRRQSENTANAVRLLDAAAVAFGTGLFLVDLFSGDRETPRFAPLAFASAGMLGISLERREEEVLDQERHLRQRAAVVERLVPRRKPKLDRIVVHV